MADGPEVQRVHTGQSITKVGEFGFPQGHLGHLTAEQTNALAKFKEIATADGSYTPASGDKPASHDDVTLLRFLRARRFVPHDALGQFRDTEAWRKQNHIPDLYSNIDVNDYDETRRLYPQWTGRRDKRGIPVYVFEVAPLNSKTMSEYLKSSETTKILNVPLGDGKKQKDGSGSNVPPRLLRLFALYENLTEFVMPLCTRLGDRPHPDTPISQSNNIVDISKVGLKQFWNLRSHMQDASTLATAHYPETLDRIFIVGAPSFFPTVWSWIKRWFDPITVSKIFILTESSAYDTLASFIEPENIPKKYGGKLDWSWGSPPLLDREESAHLRLTTPDSAWPPGPLRWSPRSASEWDLEAVGSSEGKERRAKVGTLNFAQLASAKASRPPTVAAAAAPDAKAAVAAAPVAPEATEPAKVAAKDGLEAGVAAAGMAGLSVQDGGADKENQVPGATEKAPIPPQPLITPEVPLKAITADLPAPTPGEGQKELGA